MKIGIQHLAMPKYVIEETSEGFQVLFNMTGGSKSHLDLLLSEDNSRLNIVGTKMYSDVVEEFLWVFILPEDVDAQNVSVKESRGYYLVSIPKVALLSRLPYPKHQQLQLHLAAAV